MRRRRLPSTWRYIVHALLILSLWAEDGYGMRPQQLGELRSVSMDIMVVTHADS